MKLLPYIFAITALTMAGCKPEAHQDAAADSNASTYEVQGILREVSPDHRTATIQHQKIPGYMPAMTMPFNVKVPQELDGIEIGADITFKLVVQTNEHWIQDIRFLALRIENMTNQAFASRAKVTELKPGDPLPDGEMLAENGKTIRFSDFRGKALAFTFFFSRCPLPEYCPRMASNFLKAREALLSNANAPANWQLLSVSFDPGFDNPDVLAAYGNFARGTNADRWLFAAMPTNVLVSIAPKLDLMVVPEGGSITHNLRTVVLDPQGRIFRQFDNNTWTPEQLTDAIIEAARVTQQLRPSRPRANFQLFPPCEAPGGLFNVAFQHDQKLLQLLAPFRRRLGVLNAVPHVGMNQRFRQRLDGLARGDQLHENFRTVAILFQHPLDGVQLADDAAHPELLGIALTAGMGVRFHAAHKVSPGWRKFNSCPV